MCMRQQKNSKYSILMNLSLQFNSWYGWWESHACSNCWATPIQNLNAMSDLCTWWTLKTLLQLPSTVGTSNPWHHILPSLKNESLSIFPFCSPGLLLDYISVLFCMDEPYWLPQSQNNVDWSKIAYSYVSTSKGMSTSLYHNIRSLSQTIRTTLLYFKYKTNTFVIISESSLKIFILMCKFKVL
jgi:hypothetical protein